MKLGVMVLGEGLVLFVAVLLAVSPLGMIFTAQPLRLDNLPPWLAALVTQGPGPVGYWPETASATAIQASTARTGHHGRCTSPERGECC